MDEMTLDEEITLAFEELAEEMKEEGLSEQEVTEKIKNINCDNALTEIIDLNVKEKLDYFNTHMYEISHERKVITYHVIAHQEEYGESASLLLIQCILWLLKPLSFFPTM